jgi:hypothetical protein
MDENEAKRPAEGKRKPYRGPEVKQVALRPEEAVLGNCKITGSSGPATSNCTTFVCSSVGS